ncbi:MAG: tyrosine-protein phosphatase [Acidobacteriia bacterium]|nr:tyrosine-protein phosphatase [Methyloceanibacter sp.]MCL6490915.1 tyrosine-protein phosphatase [Terriglobia bacterium]
MADDMTEQSLLPVVVPLEGASNVRDLGGWPTRNGGRVRFGKVFRGAALDRISEADKARLAGLGLRTVCDFRGIKEASRAPSRLDSLPGISIHALPIEPRIGASILDILATREATGEDVKSLMHRAYRSYVLEWHVHYRRLFELLLDENSGPLLFHCSAGKDRTGFGAALLLSALDVPWEAVMEDYLATNRLWRADHPLLQRIPAAAAETLLRVHPDLLEAAFATIRSEYGSFDRYLRDVLGVDAGRREQLQTMLVS